MKIYLISNNLLVEGLNYENKDNLETIRMVRALSIKGEEKAKEISKLSVLNNVEKIYSSFYSSAISSAKYLSSPLELDIYITEKLNDCKVGLLGSKNMKMVKGMQDHEFSYKLPNGESLLDVGNRINNFVNSIKTKGENVAIFTHKRAILGFLLKYGKVGYNLDDNLILEYNGKIIYDDSESDFDIYEITFSLNKIVDIKKI